MSDSVDSSPSKADEQALLERIDAAFQAVLLSRYGGGIELVMTSTGLDGDSTTLRPASGPQPDLLRLMLETDDASSSRPGGDAVVIGRVTLAKSPESGVTDVSVLTEITDLLDPNNAGDTTLHETGLRLVPSGDATRTGCVDVVRSRETSQTADAQSLRGQRGWLPGTIRNGASTGLGNGGAGHRRSTACQLALPVAADLLTRLGLAVAAFPAKAASLTVALSVGMAPP